MNEKFTASNGVEVESGKFRKTYLYRTDLVDGRLNRLKKWDFLDGDDMEALGEYFLAKRDEELGRWRDKDYPEYVVYPKQESVTELEPGVRVVNETTGRSKDIGRGVIGACDAVVSRYGKVAQAYFAAHPEPKPWHDAKPGEVWEITYRNIARNEITRPAIRSRDKWIMDGITVEVDESMVSARRIYPEGETSD